MTAIGDIWYRYEDIQYACCVDEFDNPIPDSGSLRIVCRTFTVVKITTAGVRLNSGRFVLANATKMFACPTKQAALVSFLARKRRQAGIHWARFKRAEAAIQLALIEKEQTK